MSTKNKKKEVMMTFSHIKQSILHKGKKMLDNKKFKKINKLYKEFKENNNGER